jgi:hypothetical protein
VLADVSFVRGGATTVLLSTFGPRVDDAADGFGAGCSDELDVFSSGGGLAGTGRGLAATGVFVDFGGGGGATLRAEGIVITSLQTGQSTSIPALLSGTLSASPH